MSSYLYNIMYGSVGYNMAPYVVNRVSPFAAMAGAMVAPSSPTPTQFVQQAFPMPPAAPAAPSAPSASTPSGGGGRDTQTGTGTTISGGTQGGFNIGSANVATAAQTAESMAIENASIMSPSTYGDLLAGQIGLATSVNPNTGLVSASPPGFMGMMGAGSLGVVASAMGSFMQKKQEQATINSININNTENGVVSVNGMNVAVVDGKLYGNLTDPVTGQQMPYHTVKKAVLQYLQQNPYNAPIQSNIMQNIMMSEEAQMAVEDVMAYAYAEPGRGTGSVIGSQGGEFGTGSHPGEAGGSSSSSSGGGGAAGAATGPGSGASTGAGSGWGGMAFGGRVGMANGDLALNPGQAGFVDGPPEQFTPTQTVADTENGQVQEGSFVINAPAVEFAGSDDIRKMVLNAYATAREKGLDIGFGDPTIDEENVDVALSKGEVVVPPALVKIIGLDRLRKINNRGKREVGERQQQAAQGGFINGYANGDLVGDVGEEIPYESDIPLPESTKKKFNKFLKSKKDRASVEQLIDSLTDKERLAVIALVETTAATDPVESMVAVGQTAINRASTNRPDFKNVNDLSAVMKQRSSRGSGSRMFQYDGLEPTNLSERLTEVVEGRVPGAVSKIFSAAEILTSPEYEFDPILPEDVMFYTTPTAPLAQDFEKNPLMQYHSSMGGHDYYSLMAAPELP